MGGLICFVPKTITVGFTDGCDVVLSPDAFNCLGPALYRAAEQLYAAMSDHVYG